MKQVPAKWNFNKENYRVIRICWNCQHFSSVRAVTFLLSIIPSQDSALRVGGELGTEYSFQRYVSSGFILMYLKIITSRYQGYTRGRAVSRWIPTVAARVRSQVRSCGICGGQSGTGAGFLRVLRFPCQSSFHRLLHNHHNLSSAAGTIGQQWPTYKVDSEKKKNVTRTNKTTLLGQNKNFK
jgi:hypothetical protein